MDKIPTHRHYSKLYPILRVYREDLEEIVELLSSNFSEIEIQAMSYNLKDISELSSFNKETISNFSVAAYDRENKDSFREYKLCIHFEEKSSTIYIDNRDDIKCVGIENKIDSILKKRIRYINLFKTKLIDISFFILYFIIYISIIYKYKINTFETMSWISLYCGVYTIIMIILFSRFVNFISNNIIYTRYSAELPNFIRRNKDNLTIGLICATLGTIIGGIIVYVITKK